MQKSPQKQNTITINYTLYQLLQRCAEIEERSVDDILHSLLMPYLRKYRHDTLEEWQEAREREEMEKMIRDFEADDGFDPNHIPFDTQVLAIRRKLDDLEREIQAGGKERPDLEKIRFSVLEDLNFAEQEALEKQQQEQARKSEKWQQVCTKFILE